MADAVGIGEKTEKSDSPKIPARATHIYEAWKIEASSEHALVEPGTDTGVSVRAAAYDFRSVSLPKSPSARICSRKAAQSAAEERICGSIESGKTEIKMAGSENQLIKMKNF